MTAKIYIPRDSSALAVGAEKVAVAIAAEAKVRGLDVEIIRNGSRGLYWLETLVEVSTPNGRVAYGPVKVKDVPSLFDADFINAKPHALSLGLTEEIDWLKKTAALNVCARWGD